MAIIFKQGIPTTGTMVNSPDMIDSNYSDTFPEIDLSRVAGGTGVAYYCCSDNNANFNLPVVTEDTTAALTDFLTWTISSAEFDAQYAISGLNKLFTFYDVKCSKLDPDSGDEVHYCLFGKITSRSLNQYNQLRISVEIMPGIYYGESFDPDGSFNFVDSNHVSTVSFYTNAGWYPGGLFLGAGYTQSFINNPMATPYMPFFGVVAQSYNQEPSWTMPKTIDFSISGSGSQRYASSSATTGLYTRRFFCLNMQSYINNLNVLPETPEDTSEEVGPPSGPGGNSPGGNGRFDDSSDSIDLPTDPSIGVSNVGFVRVYNTGINSLQTLGIELFPPLAYTAPTPISATDTMDAIVNGFNSMVTFFANIPSFFEQMTANTLINYVIDCHVIPVNPGAGSDEAIVIGSKVMRSRGGRIYKDYVDFPCGSINIGQFYDNFADLLTNGKLYLPFVGFVPTRPEWFQGSTLSVDYKFNVIDGSFACFVRSGGRFVNNGGGSTIVGQYAGNACIHLPVTGASYASMAAGLVGAGSGMLAGAASGNIATVATSAIAAASAHGDIAASNAYNGSAAFLGCRRPFLMIERPVSHYARNYQHEIGLPANIYATLGDVPGYVRMETVHVDGISGATETEKNEIKRLLAQGVIV